MKPTTASLDPSRAATSCTECQRRKQKCSREWPCDHCRARKVSHLCQFVTKQGAATKHPNNESARGSRGRKRGNVDTSQSSAAGEDVFNLNTEPEMRELGFMADRFNLGNGQNEHRNSSLIKESHSQLEEVRAALPIFPPRFLTDILVQNFFRNVNYFYYCLYPPQFLDQYSSWWEERTADQQLRLDFTCLLLRVCACSAQFLDLAARKQLESQLGSNAQTLTENYHSAAEKLSRSLGPGKGGLVQVQQLFLTASWCKAENLFVDSWHALSWAIREAQELGMHKSTISRGLTEFDIEIRRRVWCLLHLWDWQMSRWLSRPLLIDQNSCSFELPNLRLEESSSQPGLPSPFTPVKLQCQVIESLTAVFQKMGNGALMVKKVQDEIDKWIESFPSAYHITTPDTTWDKEHPHVVMQRHQLYAMANMIRLNPLKPYLIKTPTSKLEAELRTIGVDSSLKLLQESHHLFDLLFPTGMKYFLVIWLYFDTGCILCSALIHDEGSQSLPKRREVREAADFALQRLQQLQQVSKTAATSYKILSKLVAALPSSSLFHPNIPTGSPDSMGTKRRCQAASPLTPTSGSRSTPSESSAAAPPDAHSNTATPAHSTDSPDRYPTPPNPGIYSSPPGVQGASQPTLLSYNDPSYLNPTLEFNHDRNTVFLPVYDPTLSLDLESSGLGSLWSYDSLNLDIDIGLRIDPSIDLEMNVGQMGMGSEMSGNIGFNNSHSNTNLDGNNGNSNQPGYFWGGGSGSGSGGGGGNGPPDVPMDPNNNAGTGMGAGS